jgi:hypothetical protein
MNFCSVTYFGVATAAANLSTMTSKRGRCNTLVIIRFISVVLLEMTTASAQMQDILQPTLANLHNSRLL